MRQSDARPRNGLAWRGRRAGFGLGRALVCLCALQAYVADDHVVFERDPQGRWTEVLRVGPSRTVTRLRSSGGKLMVSERLVDRGRWQATLWVRR